MDELKSLKKKKKNSQNCAIIRNRSHHQKGWYSMSVTSFNSYQIDVLIIQDDSSRLPNYPP